MDVDTNFPRYLHLKVPWVFVDSHWPFRMTLSVKHRVIRIYDSQRKFKSSPPGQNGPHFPDDIFKCIFMNEKFRILIQISLKFVPKGAINNIVALVQIMALALIWQQAIIWINAQPIHWRIYAALGGDEFKKTCLAFVLDTVFADGLAPLGARKSADTVMTMLQSLIYSQGLF